MTPTQAKHLKVLIVKMQKAAIAQATGNTGAYIAWINASDEVDAYINSIVKV